MKTSIALTPKDAKKIVRTQDAIGKAVNRMVKSIDKIMSKNLGPLVEEIKTVQMLIPGRVKRAVNPSKKKGK